MLKVITTYILNLIINITDIILLYLYGFDNNYMIFIIALIYLLLCPILNIIYLKNKNNYITSKLNSNLKDLSMNIVDIDCIDMYDYNQSIMLKQQKLNITLQMNKLDYFLDILLYLTLIIVSLLFVSLFFLYSLIVFMLSFSLMFLVNFLYSKKNYNNKIANVENETKSNYYRDIQLDINAYKDIKTNNYNDFLMDKSLTYFKLAINERYNLRRKNAISYNLTKFLFMMIVIVTSILSFVLIYHNFSYSKLYVLIYSLISITLYNPKLTEAIANLTVVSKINMQPLKQETKTDHIFDTVESIRFENVCFSYGDKQIFNNLSITLNKNKKYCILGENGSGKTTFLLLLIGVLKPNFGNIYINDINVSLLSDSDKNKLFSICFQEAGKFYDTILNNVSFGKKTNIEKVIDKYDNNQKIGSQIYKDGIELSLGEWQKIFLNRALLKKGDIYIFDEPTSSLDLVYETLFYTKLNNIGNIGSICLYVTHKVGYANLADDIILFKDGKIIEYGNAKEVFNRKGEFYEMCKIQNANF